jgi:hypothetical protein
MPYDLGTEETVGINLPLPRDLHRQLKARAASNGLTVRQAVIEAVIDWVLQDQEVDA